MARRRRHSESDSVASAASIDPLDPLLAPLPQVDVRALTLAAEAETRRLNSLTQEELFRAYHPDWDTPPGVRASEYHARRRGLPVVEKRPPRSLDPLRWFVGPGTMARVLLSSPFKKPRERRAICSYRRVRREVMFATKRTGKGSGSRRRRNEWSNVSCR